MKTQLTTKLLAAVLKTSSKLMTATAVSAVAMTAVTAQAATMSERQIQTYVSNMANAANSQNMSGIARLIDDDAIISLSRKNETSTLNKSEYLQLLKRLWNKSSNYKYSIEVSDMVITGDQARIRVIITEQFTEDGKPMIVKSQSRATLKLASPQNNAVLLRSVSQIKIN